MNTVTKGEVMANMKEVVCRTEEVLGKPVTVFIFKIGRAHV